MKKTTLVVMAAGIGSRFGGGIKQLAPVGPNGEIIMDYSIYDALEAGFDKIVFIARISRRISARASATAWKKQRTSPMSSRIFMTFRMAIPVLRTAKNPGAPVRLCSAAAAWWTPPLP